MKQKEIREGAVYSRGDTWADRKYEGEFDSMTGEKPELVEETMRPMTRTVIDIFHGNSGDWVAYQLPWGEVRAGRLRSFARWAKFECCVHGEAMPHVIITGHGESAGGDWCTG